MSGALSLGEARGCADGAAGARAGAVLSAPVLGVDPGHEGAAVLLAADGRRALTALSWRRLERKGGAVYEVSRLAVADDVLPSLHAVGVAIVARAREVLQYEPAPSSSDPRLYRLAVEGLFARPGLELHGVVSLAEATGELLGALRGLALETLRPKASTWRPAVLGLPANGASVDAELAAWRALAVGRPPLLEGLDVWLARTTITHRSVRREHPAWPHVVEAACIARWGWAQGALERRFVRGA